ncbi:MAG TPA: cell wall-binding repeat-containing protein [Nitriliruptorales bacterium]|nr:cell wall-binding repeat-containing protein [Nitriliruptorales bacterium]
MGQGTAASRRARTLHLALILGLAALTAPLSAGRGTAQSATDTGGIRSLRLVGHSDLGGDGLNGEVTAVGDAVVVAAGILPAGGIHTHLYNPYPCPAVTVKVVDISDPTAPTVASTIAVPKGVVAADVAAMAVDTPAFTGDLLAVAMAVCSGPGSFVDRGVAYYDISDPTDPRFLGRYFADAEAVPPDAPPCGPGAGTACASSQHAVWLVQRPDGRVLSLSTEPFASASGFESGDLRIVDVTDPRTPTQVGSYPLFDQIPPGFGDNFTGFSHNGCRPFDAGHSAEGTPDGDTALLAYMDQGLLTADIADPSTPSGLGRWGYDRDARAVEGNAAYVTFGTAGDRPLALLSEEDWIGPDTRLRIDSPPELSGERFACEAMFTLFDPEDTAQIYRQPGSSVPESSGELVYVGRACPERESFSGDPVAADPLMADPQSRTVLVDRGAIQTGLPPTFCSFASRVQRLQEAGALGVVIAQTSSLTPEAFSADGDPSGLVVPAIMIDKPDADQLRSTLCPTPEDGDCSGGQPVTGAMIDRPGEWGALRILDIADPTSPQEIATYRPPTASVFPPPDLGVYSVHHAVTSQDLAFLASNSDGLRVLDLSAEPPGEVASFVPPDIPDPTGVLPAKAYVVGVATAGNVVLVSDINSGLYVLSFDDLVRRLGGATRIETAVAISQDSYPAGGSAEAAVLARADDPDGYADALAGTPLAVANDAPLLITYPPALHTRTEAELRRVLPPGKTVYLLGGDVALAPAVEQRIQELGYRTRRIFGPTRVETAIAIAQELGDPDTLMVTTGYDFADALPAGAASAHVEAAVLLTVSEQRHPATDAYLAARSGATLFAVGGPAARPYAQATPVFGPSREETAVEVARRFFADPTVVGVARRDRFPDSLTGGVHVARRGGPVLLTFRDVLHAAPAAYLCDTAASVRTASLYGGTVALSETVRADVAARISGLDC